MKKGEMTVQSPGQVYAYSMHYGRAVHVSWLSYTSPIRLASYIKTFTSSQNKSLWLRMARSSAQAHPTRPKAKAIISKAAITPFHLPHKPSISRLVQTAPAEDRTCTPSRRASSRPTRPCRAARPGPAPAPPPRAGGPFQSYQYCSPAVLSSKRQ